jgi:histidine triad (HIT) family protein
MDDLCRLIRDGLPGVTLLYESHRVLAFQAPAPAWQAHIFVVSRKHIDSLTAAARADEPVLVELLGIVARMSREVEEAWGGCRISTTTGSAQAIPHLHFEICAGAALVG